MPEGTDVLDALPIAVGFVDDDALVYVNAAFEEMTGWTGRRACSAGRSRPR